MYMFGDGFDSYAVPADALAGYWDSGSGFTALTTGRFTGSRACGLTSFQGGQLVKSSGNNDSVHHLVFGFYQNASLGNTSVSACFQLNDGASAQCFVAFDGNGRMFLASGAMTTTPTILVQWPTAVTAGNIWIAYEIEVVIHNTAGSITVRRNGNNVNDFQAINLNTRAGSTNNYANRLTIGMPGNPGANFQQIDDLLWRSDPTAVPWVGDIRCYTRMPVSDVSKQFAASPPTVSVNVAVLSTQAAQAAGALIAAPFTVSHTGTIGSATFAVPSAATGHVKAAIYDSTRNVLLATSSETTNPVAGINTVTFTPPLSVTAGQTYWLAFDQDATITFNVQTLNNLYSATVAYASFPPSTLTANALASANMKVSTVTVTATLNCEYVNEAQQDGTATYVYDSNVGDVDFYGFGTAPIPAAILVTTRGFVEKSDAGTRGAAVQLRSGSTTVQSTPTALGTGFQWLWRSDINDPNTGAAWTGPALNAIQAGPIVTS
jgi:hypothetical protein